MTKRATLTSAGTPARKPSAKPTPGTKDAPPAPVARNRRARHDYDIMETFECGIALTGSEVKSVRAGKVQLQDAYARIIGGEVWLIGAHIAPYEFAPGVMGHDPTRTRKLLLHRHQIDGMVGTVQQQRLTLIPLSVYLKNGKVKVSIALARGRQLHDRRRVIAERDMQRDLERESSQRR